MKSQRILVSDRQWLHPVQQRQTLNRCVLLFKQFPLAWWRKVSCIIGIEGTLHPSLPKSILFYECSSHMWICVLHVWLGPGRAEEEIVWPGVVVTDVVSGCKLPHMCWEADLGPVEEEVLWTTEPSHQPFQVFLYLVQIEMRFFTGCHQLTNMSSIDFSACASCIWRGYVAVVWVKT